MVTSGRARGVVVGTGANTAIGRIRDALTTDEDATTPLKRKLDEFGTLLSKVCGAWVCVRGCVAHSLASMSPEPQWNQPKPLCHLALNARTLSTPCTYPAHTQHTPRAHPARTQHTPRTHPAHPSMHTPSTHPAHTPHAPCTPLNAHTLHRSLP